jgi:heat shock protein HtpX
MSSSRTPSPPGATRNTPPEAHPETAQMMILNPLSAGGIKGLFSTHPPTGERIASLRAMAC